jgi:hypothetical protein
MADRKASVTLELKAAQFKAEAAAAEKSVDGLDRKVEALDRDISKLPADSTRAAAGLGILDESAKKTGRDINDLGVKTDQANKKITEAGEGTKTLRSRMDELEGSLKKTGTEFAKSSDPSLLKKFRADSSELSGLRSTVSEMEKLGLNVKQLGLEATKAESLFGSLQAGFEGGATSPGGLGIAGIAAVPALATAGGAAVAGIGALGAGAGVASAVMGDPKAFQAAWGEAAGSVRKDFLAAGDAFVGPTMDAIKTIGPTIHSWNLTAALAPASRYLPAIVDGLERGATGLEHGIADGIKKAGPAVAALSQGIAQLGTAAGDALSHISDGAAGGSQALHDTFTAVSAVVEGFGLLTEGAEKAYGAINDHPFISAGFTAGLSIPASLAAKALGDVDEGGLAVAGMLPGVASAAQTASGAFDNVAGTLRGVALSSSDTAAALDIATHSFSEATDKALALNDANAAVTLGLKGVKEGFEGGAHALDTANVKGAQNVQLIDEQIRKLQEKRDADIAAGGSTAEAYAKADQAYNNAITDLQRTIGKLGAGSKAAADFFDQFHDRKINIEISVITKHRTVYSDGILYGSAEGAEEHRYGNKAATGLIRHMAVGGAILPASDPGTLIVGEPPTHGEAWIPLAGIGKDRAMDLTKVVADSYGFDVGPRDRWRDVAPRGAWQGGQAGPVTVAVTLAAAPGADTGVGSFLNSLIRNGYVVVKASQVRSG